MTRTASDTRDRTFVLGPEKVRATILAAGTETGGRGDLAGVLRCIGVVDVARDALRRENRVGCPLKPVMLGAAEPA